MWTAEAALDIDAPPERVWALLADVPGWPHWNAGVASATLHGPLASGSHFEISCRMAARCCAARSSTCGPTQASPTKRRLKASSCAWRTCSRRNPKAACA